MDLKKLDINGLENIYNNYMLKDFPKEELKSLKKITRLAQKEQYMGFGIYDLEELVGYAFFMTFENIILLDYFAILEDKRSSGIGSIAINILSDYFKDKFDVFILESENPSFAKNLEDKAIREKRIRFYEKNLFTKTAIKAKVYGVDFTIFVKNDKINDNGKIANLLYNLYVAMSTKEKCEENVFIGL